MSQSSKRKQSGDASKTTSTKCHSHRGHCPTQQCKIREENDKKAGTFSGKVVWAPHKDPELAAQMDQNDIEAMYRNAKFSFKYNAPTSEIEVIGHMENFLSRGSFGVVFATTRDHVVVKCADKSKNPNRCEPAMIALLTESHPYDSYDGFGYLPFPFYYGVCDDEVKFTTQSMSISKMYSIMAIERMGDELADGIVKYSTPARLIPYTTPLQTFQIAYAMIHALAFLHAKGIVHLDLKPANIMFGQGDRGNQLYLIDLGLAAHTKPDLEQLQLCGGGLSIQYGSEYHVKANDERNELENRLEAGGAPELRFPTVADIYSLFYIMILLNSNKRLPWTVLSAKMMKMKCEERAQQMDLIRKLKMEMHADFENFFGRFYQTLCDKEVIKNPIMRERGAPMELVYFHEEMLKLPISEKATLATYENLLKICKYVFQLSGADHVYKFDDTAEEYYANTEETLKAVSAAEQLRPRKKKKCQVQ